MAKQRPLRKDAMAIVLQVEKPDLSQEQPKQQSVPANNQAKLGATTLISKPARYIVGIIHLTTYTSPIAGFVTVASAKEYTVPLLQAITVAEAASMKFSNAAYNPETNTVKMLDIAVDKMIHLDTNNNLCGEANKFYVVARNVVTLPGNRRTTTYTVYNGGRSLRQITEAQLKHIVQAGGSLVNFKIDGDILTSKNANTLIEYTQSIVRPKTTKQSVDRTKEKLSAHAKFIDAFVNALMHGTLTIMTDEQRLAVLKVVNNGKSLERAIISPIPQPVRRALKTMSLQKFQAIVAKEILPLYFERMHSYLGIGNISNVFMDRLPQSIILTPESFWAMVVKNLADMGYVPFVTERDLVNLLTSRPMYYKNEAIYRATDTRYVFCNIDHILGRVNGISTIEDRGLPKTTYALTAKEFRYLFLQLCRKMINNPVMKKTRLESSIGAGMSIFSLENNNMLVIWPRLGQRYEQAATAVATATGDKALYGYVMHIFTDYVWRKRGNCKAYEVNFYLRRNLLMLDALYEYIYRVHNYENLASEVISLITKAMGDPAIDTPALLDAMSYSAVNHLHITEEANYSLPILKLFIVSGGLMFPYSTRTLEHAPEMSDIITPFSRVNSLALKDATHHKTHKNSLLSSLGLVQFSNDREGFDALTDALKNNEIKYTYVEKAIRNLYFVTDYTDEPVDNVKYAHEYTNCFATHLHYFLTYYARKTGNTELNIRHRGTMKTYLGDILATLCVPYVRYARPYAPDPRFKTIRNASIKAKLHTMKLW